MRYGSRIESDSEVWGTIERDYDSLYHIIERDYVIQR